MKTKKSIVVVTMAFSASILLMVPLSVHANNALAQAKNCLICHAPEKTVIGPSFAAIKKRYATQDLSKVLAEKIIRGSSGGWGALPMPANSQVTEAESLVLAKWILGLEK